MSSAGISGISSLGSASYAGSPPSAGALQAQLQRYQTQLSDCVNCASAKTPQGKADIQAISARISQVRQSIEQTEKPRPEASGANPVTSASPAFAPTGFGGLIDVFA